MGITRRSELIRTAAVLVTVAGTAGWLLMYFTASPYVPEYDAALLVCGALVLAGATLFLAASSAAAWARLARPGSAVIVVGALGASLYTGVAARLWFQAVIHFS